MKFIKIKNALALMLAAGAMLIASTASSMCFGGRFEEPKMPESLYKHD